MPAPAADVEPPALPQPRLAIVPREGAAQSELRIGHLSARRNTPDYPALLVMNARARRPVRQPHQPEAARGEGLHLRRAHRVRLAARARAVLAAGERAHGGDGRRDSRLACASSTAIRGSRPPTEDELALAKASLTRGYPRNFETAQQVARSVAQLALYDLPDTYFEEFVPEGERRHGRRRHARGRAVSRSRAG